MNNSFHIFERTSSVFVEVKKVIVSKQGETLSYAKMKQQFGDTVTLQTLQFLLIDWMAIQQLVEWT